MDKREDSGQAFPQPISGGGMSLRDWFAGQALMGMMANGAGVELGSVGVAQSAYHVADAMLAERGQ